MDEFHKKIHQKHMVTIDGVEYCKKCDYGYIETLDLKAKDLLRFQYIDSKKIFIEENERLY